MITETSLESFRQIVDLGDRQRVVYNTIKMYPGESNRTLGIILNKPINTITPRVKELRVLGLVKEDDKKYDKVTNRWVMTWRAVP